MKCDECKWLMKGLLGLCDGICLKENDTVDSQQLQNLVGAQENNVPKINLFLQRNAGKMMKYLFDHEDVNMRVIAVAVYFNKLGSNIRAKLESLDDAAPEKVLYVKMSNGHQVNVRQLLMSLKND